MKKGTVCRDKLGEHRSIVQLVLTHVSFDLKSHHFSFASPIQLFCPTIRRNSSLLLHTVIFNHRLPFLSIPFLSFLQLSSKPPRPVFSVFYHCCPSIILILYAFNHLEIYTSFLKLFVTASDFSLTYSLCAFLLNSCGYCSILNRSIFALIPQSSYFETFLPAESYDGGFPTLSHYSFYSTCFLCVPSA